TGVLYLSEPNRICVANGDDGTLKIFDGASYELLSTVQPLDDADNIRLDAAKNLIYAGYGSGALAVIDAASLKTSTSLKLQGHPESFQLEQKGQRIFVNIPDAKQVAVIDRAKNSLAATWPMREFQANFPMALEETSHRLFVGCRKPARLVVLDTQNGKLVSSLPIAGDTDDLFYDARLKRIYISCGEGFIDVVDQLHPDRYELRERLPTSPGARTSFLSADLRQLFLAAPKPAANRNAEIHMFT